MNEVKDIVEFFSIEEHLDGLEVFLLLVSLMSFGGFLALKIARNI